MATVVAKLFALAGPCRAYFGEKDYQQVAVVRRMTADLRLPVEVVACPTVRDRDGLALSSRNARLSPAGRARALGLSRALAAGADAVAAGERDPRTVEAVMAAVVAATPGLELDYAVAVDPSTLTRPLRLEGEVRLLVAGRVGPVRLIDNVGAVAPPGAPAAAGVPPPAARFDLGELLHLASHGDGLAEPALTTTDLVNEQGRER